MRAPRDRAGLDPRLCLAVGLAATLAASLSLRTAGAAVFNVRDYGATGTKSDDARPALQKAIDACATAGGGTVVLPPGNYTSGTLHLRSRLHLRLETGATLFASPDPGAYNRGQPPLKAALLYGEGLEDVTLSGAGTIDGQAEYEWRLDDHERAFDHKDWMQALGKPLLRSFPKGFPQRNLFPHLVWLGRSTNVRINGLHFRRSPNWTLALYACARVRCQGLDVRSSLREGVWADGLDLDGCREVSVSDCTIETGDDCLVFISTDAWGPALPCENIRVNRCRLSSASAGIKFSEGNRVGVRNVVVTDTVLTNVNRGVVFTTTLGGDITDVTLSNLTIHCNRFDWFWSGDGQPFHFRVTRLGEFNREPAQPGEAPPGAIRRVAIRNVTAHAKGSSAIHGHPENWLEDITLENLRLFLATDPSAPFDKAEHALDIRRARNLTLKNLAVSWAQPALETWQSALHFEEVRGLDLEAVSARAAWPDRDRAAVQFHNVTGARLQRARALEGTRVFLEITGEATRDVRIQGNDFRHARLPCRLAPEVEPGRVTLQDNLLPGP